jgi:hypothetical protein
MPSILEAIGLGFIALILGLIIMIIMVLAKEWTQHTFREFWPKLSRADPLDLELGFAFCEGLKDLAWRVEQLEGLVNKDDQFTEYYDDALIPCHAS